MARNVQDILQRILISGESGVISAFGKIANAGTSAFTSIGNAVGRATAPFSKFTADLDNVEKKANAFGRSLADAGSKIGSFATRMSAAGAALTAGGGLLAKGMLGISTAVKSVSASLIEQKLAASQATGEQKKAIQTNFAHSNALSDLNAEWATGKLTVEQYAEQLRKLNREQEREVAQQKEMERAAERLREEQAAAMAEAQKRQVQIKLEAQYGGALASVILNLANVLDTVRQRFFSAFGPRIAQMLTAVIQGISEAAPQIFAIFDKIASSFEAAFAKSGITVQGLIKGILSFAEQASNIIINVVIPAFKIFVDILNVIAEAINKVFGTNFSASTIVAAIAIGKLTGAFSLLVSGIKLAATAFGVLRAAAGPWGLLITAIAVGITLLIPLLEKVDWAGWAKTATDAWKNIKDIVGAVADGIVAAWTGVVDFFRSAINSIIGFFKDLIKTVKEFLGLTGGTSGGGGSLGDALGANDIPGRARGGLFRGRRSGTDQNLAWLTDKEYVINPKATRYWGVDFLNMINRMSGGIRGFAEGGLNSALSMPAARVAFAGGSAGGSTNQRPLVLNIGDQEFTGLTVEDRTADNMARFAQRRGVRSAGRRPLWFGGTR